MKSQWNPGHILSYLTDKSIHLKIELWWISKTKFSFVQEGVQEFTKRIQRYYPFDVVTIETNIKDRTPAIIKKKEAEIIASKISAKDYLILLDENGKGYDSVQFAEKLEKWLGTGKQRLVFVVGGAYGFDQSIKEKAQGLLSLSKMTFSHQLIRLLFAEQLYRACTIIRGEKYHNP